MLIGHEYEQAQVILNIVVTFSLVHAIAWSEISEMSIQNCTGLSNSNVVALILVEMILEVVRIPDVQSFYFQARAYVFRSREPIKLVCDTQIPLIVEWGVKWHSSRLLAPGVVYQTFAGYFIQVEFSYSVGWCWQTP